jgi:SprT-like family
MGFLQLLLFGVRRVVNRPMRPAAHRTRRSTHRSDPTLTALWLDLRREYFPERPDIDSYQIVWSERGQKRVLATCFPTKKTVKVARELRDPVHAEWLRPLLYHEMCHAYLGKVANANGRMMWHGPEFRALERRHPESARLDRWIKSGGWSKAVRSDRARRAAAKRRSA